MSHSRLTEASAFEEMLDEKGLAICMARKTPVGCLWDDRLPKETLNPSTTGEKGNPYGLLPWRHVLSHLILIMKVRKHPPHLSKEKLKHREVK